MIHYDQLVLFAADDWFQIVGGIIVMVMWGIQQIFAGRQEAKNARPKKVRQPRKPVARPADGAPPPNQADPLRAEVEQFLKQAEETKQQPRQRETQSRDSQWEQKQRPARREPLRSGDPSEKQRRPTRSTGKAGKELRRRPSRTSETDSVKSEVNEPRVEGVDQHVARHLSTASHQERAVQLGGEVAQADDRLEARLEQTFEHRLGSLSHSEDQVQEVGPSVADEVRELLSQPQGMRQLIVANEILRRPQERW